MNSFLENRPALGRKDGLFVSPQHQSGFQSLFSKESPKPADEDAASAPQAESEAAVPRIELVQSGGKVDRIIVTCSCCKRIELQCQY